MNSFSDENLMLAVGGGDIAQLGLLFERYYRQLFNFFLRWIGQPDRSEDLVQEVFCRILKYRKSFADHQPFLPWFFRIAHNVGNDYFRKTPTELPISEDFEPVAELDQQRTLDKRADFRNMEKALRKLAPDKRELVVLCRFHNLKYDQIAELLGCSVGAIKVRLHRALKELSHGYQMQVKETAS